ncbi:hypothetical protein [Anabaena azotica]|uniref:Uncharacterized protein n=1 Tax=Anabaena azotica FACHB-119 TaxID=947527 RepID=A0ABR8CYA5_9NOST|nr:hypothetical protein [Anabaena azotica]MBD2499863.1 hypothetical protein [Anabaena azotica FACHB-119]
MNKINFAGIECQVLQSSPHGNYIVVKLSKRIVICGTYSNQFNWDESPDLDSGFTSFITYIGLRNELEFPRFRDLAIAHNGYFDRDDGSPRKAKRVIEFPLEIKVRGLLPESVVELVKLG